MTLLFVIVADSALLPPWLVKKNEKVANHNKNIWFFFQAAETNNFLNYQFKFMVRETVM